MRKVFFHEANMSKSFEFTKVKNWDIDSNFLEFSKEEEILIIPKDKLIKIKEQST